MTVHMQESEAARDFSRFISHLAAGDQVRLEREGKRTLLVYNADKRPEPSRIDDIEREQREFTEKHGPVLFEPDVVELLREAHDLSNQPLELRIPEMQA